MKKVFLTTMACLLIAVAANAQDTNFYAGVNLHSSTWMSYSMDSWSNSLLVGLIYDNMRFEIYPMFNFSTNESKTSGVKTETKSTLFGLGGNFFYDFEKNGLLTPFIGAGISLGKSSDERKVGGVKSAWGNESSTRYSLNAQGGVSLSLAESWNFDIALGLYYHGRETKDTVTDVKTTSNAFSAALGLKLRYTF